MSAQALNDASAASRHFGGVVLWMLDPLAAGEVLIRAGDHPRLLCGSWASYELELMIVRMHYNARNNILSTYITTAARI